MGSSPGREARDRPCAASLVMLAGALAVAAAVAVAAVGPASAADAGGVCRRSGRHCRRDAQCCEGLICASGQTCQPGCRIGGTIYAAGAADPLDPCLVCRPDASAHGWSPAPDGTACDDGDGCTVRDACRAGTCVGGPGLDCDDGVACTADSCRPAAGCLHTPDASRCDDHDICTNDSCDPVSGCTHAPVTEGGACEMWGANGPVSALALSGNTLYVGGDFTRIGPATGSFVALDGATGAPSSAFPKVDGEVYAIAPDGSGGWFVGGSFAHVGNQSKRNLAHVLPDGSVASWDPDPDSVVYRLQVRRGTVYAAGYFTNVGGQSRSYIAALDPVTGQATGWDPSADGPVIALFATDDVVYAGGYFYSIGGQARTYLAALDAGTGQALPWDPGPDGPVTALMASGGTVYVGGTFDSIGGQPRTNLAAFDASTGMTTSWAPDPDGEVQALVVSGGVLYAGGYFANIAGQNRNFLAAFDAGTGLVTRWDPSADGAVIVLEVDGSAVYAGGFFTQIGGQARHNLAALDLATGLSTAWDPDPDAGVFAVAVSDGTVFAGGQFASFGTQARVHLAAFDVGTGRPTPWHPDPDGVVQALVVSDGTLYVGGQFTAIAGQPRDHLAAFGTATGALTSWDPDANASVKALAAGEGTVYAAGDFTSVGGLPRSGVAALDAATGRTTAWDPGSVAGAVDALAVDDGRVFAAGSFTTIGAQFRNHVAALDASTGQLTSWNPYADAETVALAAGDGVVHAGGSFRAVGDALRQRIAAIDGRSGETIAWDPGANGTVRALAVRRSIVYAGGDFDSIGGQARVRLAALDAASGRALAWNPPVDGGIAAIAAGEGTTFVGGSFRSAGGRLSRNIAALRAAASSPCAGAAEAADGPSAAPGAPTIPFPLDGGKRCSSSTGLSWTAAAGAATYDVFVDGHPECESLAGTSCSPAGMTEGTHTWYVTARNACGSTTGPTWTFLQSGPPEEPLGPSPPDQGSVCPRQVLSWEGPALAGTVSSALPREGSRTVPRGESIETEGTGEDSDSGRQAMRLYIRKREPEPSAGIPMQDYLTALERVKSMRRYSTALGQFLPPRSDRSLLANAGPWKALGPGNIGGRTRALLVDPSNPDILYAGAVAGGIWKSYDGGASWAPLDDLLPNLAVTCLVFDPTNSSVLYAGTGEGDVYDGVPGAGVFRTIDGGATWTQLSATANWPYVNRLAIDPTNGRVLLAATSAGLFRTTDGGTTWTLVLADGYVKDVDFNPTDGTKAVAGGALGRIWYSTSGGSAWTAVAGLPSNSYRVEIAYAPSNPDIVYASVDRDQGEIWRSADGGHTFTVVNAGNHLLLTQGWYDNALWVDPTNSNVLFVGGVPLWRSTDGGLSVVPVDSPHTDNHVIVAHPDFDGTTNRIIYLGNDGGIYRLTDAYAVDPYIRWQELNNHYAVTQFYAGIPYPDGEAYLGGTQDNGTVRGSDADGPEDWTKIYCCDGGYVAVDPTNTDIVYAEWQGGRIIKSTNGGITFFAATSGIPNLLSFITPFVMDPSDPLVLWTGGNVIFRTNDGAASWRLAAYLRGWLSAVNVAPSDGNHVIVGSDGGYIHMTDRGLSSEGSTVWPNVQPRFGYVSWVAFDPHDPNIAYATYSTFHGAHVWRTRNGGITWRPIEGTAPDNLPDIPVHTIVVDPDDSATLYIGTDLGVFVSKDSGESWNVENGGFANVVTESLSVATANGKNMLFAFTHGRGAYEVDLTSHAGSLYDVYVDGVLKCRHTTVASCDPGVLADGPHTWYVVAERSCGSLAGPTWTFTQNSIAPSFAGLSSVTTAADCGAVDLSWPAATSHCSNGAITYNVYRSTDAGFLPAPENRIVSGVSILEYHDSLLVPGETYYYIVRAVDLGSAEDPNTARQSVRAVSGTDDRPPTFGGIGPDGAAPGPGCGEIVLSWAAAAETCSNPVRYRVYRSTDGLFEPDPQTLAAETTSTSYTDVGRIPSTTYYYIVRALDAAGNEDENMQRASSAATAIPRTIYHQDFESGPGGWGLGEPNTATSGVWELGDPVGTGAQPEDDATPGSGVSCWATGLAGGGLDADDVDDGATTLLSPVIDLAGISDPRLTYERWYSNDRGSDPGSDALLVQVSSDGGNSWSELDSTSTSTGGWQLRQLRLAEFTSITARMRFQVLAQDQPGAPSIVEAAIDDVDITGPSAGCTGCPAVSPVGTIYLRRAGDDVVVSWNADPVSAPRYVVYRVDEPTFDRPTRVGSTTVKSFTHEGAAGLPGSIFYFVSAVNACGQESAIDTEP